MAPLDNHMRNEGGAGEEEGVEGGEEVEAAAAALLTLQPVPAVSDTGMAVHVAVAQHQWAGVAVAQHQQQAGAVAPNVVAPFIALQGPPAVQVGMMFLAPETNSPFTVLAVYPDGSVLGRFPDRQYILDPSDMNRAYPVPMTDDRAVDSRTRSKTASQNKMRERRTVRFRPFP